MNNVKGILYRIAYFGLAIPMFYFVDADITFGGFGIQYQYLFGMGIICLALVAFLIDPELQRMILGLKYSGAFLTPYLWSLVYSLFLWTITLASAKTITRGLFYVLYQVIAVLAVVATIYLFGEKGIFYQLAALIIANLIYVVQAVADYGLHEFVTQYIDVVISFTAKTGNVMKLFEGFGYTFPLAFFLAYFVLDLKKNKKRWVWFIISLLLFFMGLKRSVFLSVIMAVAIGLVMRHIFKTNAKKVFSIICYLGMAVSVVYIAAVNAGLFDWLESIGMDTMGRDWISNTMKGLYEVSPGYFGKGVGFISGSLATGELKLIHEGYRVYEIHNDLLRVYIELGLIGYIIWTFLFLKYRVGYFFHKQKEQWDNNHGILTATLILTLYITFLTDNTYYYYYTTLFIAAIVIGYRFDEYSKTVELPGGN